MKNLIKYYYNIPIINLKKIKNSYTFTSGKHKYKFFACDKDCKKIIETYKILLSNNIACQEIVLNKDNLFITFYEGKNFILIKYSYKLNNIVNIEDIYKYDRLINIKYKCNWKKLWEEKIDYYEYQVSQFGLKFPKIRDSFGYYVGLAELAISLLNFLTENSLLSYISHDRIYFNESVEEFLNPVNIILDTKSRDVAEYIKINYINNNLNLDDALNIIKKSNYTFDENILMFARLLYPSYYFDLYDKVIQEYISEDKIDYYVQKNTYYEIFIKDIYKYLFYNYNFPEIEWLLN